MGGTVPGVIDLNDLRLFEKVASLRSFSRAARSLGVPKSSISRRVARLEEQLGTRLLQRTTREISLTEPGLALQARLAGVLSDLDGILGHVGGAAPRGLLRVSAGIAFGINVLSDLLPGFLERYPDVTVDLDLTSRSVDLVADSVDVAIRIGPMPDSSLVGTRLGGMQRFLCASPAYLAHHPLPTRPEDLDRHRAVEMLGRSGRPVPWSLSRADGTSARIEPRTRVSVNDALTIHRLVRNGVGVGCLSGYLCRPDLDGGALVALLPEWRLPTADVTAVFPSNRAVAPAVRAFVDFMREASVPGRLWQD